MTHAEARLQKEVVCELKGHGWIVISIPNERALGVADMKRMQGMGLTKGAPDLMAWDLQNNPWWFELKTPRGKRSDEQICFEHIAGELGIGYRVVRHVSDVQDLTRESEYLFLNTPRMDVDGLAANYKGIAKCKS